MAVLVQPAWTGGFLPLLPGDDLRGRVLARSPARRLETVREQVARMRRDVPAELEHDLGVASQRDRARVAAPAPPADEGEHGRPRAEARDPVADERLSP